jgi:hypothetical protein
MAGNLVARVIPARIRRGRQAQSRGSRRAEGATISADGADYARRTAAAIQCTAGVSLGYGKVPVIRDLSLDVGKG